MSKETGCVSAVGKVQCHDSTSADVTKQFVGGLLSNDNTDRANW